MVMEIDVQHNYFSVAEEEACANLMPSCVLHIGCYIGLYLMYLKVQYVENAILIRIYIVQYIEAALQLLDTTTE